MAIRLAAPGALPSMRLNRAGLDRSLQILTMSVKCPSVATRRSWTERRLPAGQRLAHAAVSQAASGGQQLTGFSDRGAGSDKQVECHHDRHQSIGPSVHRVGRDLIEADARENAAQSPRRSWRV